MNGPDRMAAWIAAFPQQLRDSASLPGLTEVTPLANTPAQVVLCGMGGSAAAGSLLPLLWPGPPLPWHVHRDEGLPAWAGQATLVVASSYSGETEETLGAVAEARRRGCPLAVLTSGGQLGALARAAGLPAAILPGGQPPRTALGFSFGALLHLLHRLGVAQDPGPALLAAAAHLEGDDFARREGRAIDPAVLTRLAAEVAGRFAVIYTSGAEAHAAGQRLKGQLNENAKAPAAVMEFPELTHNDIVGWNLSGADRDGFALIVLRGADENERARRRADATIALLADQFATVTQIHGQGPAPLARVMGLIHLADRLSVEVAGRCGVDPVPIARIDALKRAVAPN
jgi:glucose/mannose-6-phosphate isomerase